MVVRCNVMLKAGVLISTFPSSAILFFKIASLTESIASKTTVSAASPDLRASLEEETISVRIKSLVTYNVSPYSMDIIQVLLPYKNRLATPPPPELTFRGRAYPSVYNP